MAYEDEVKKLRRDLDELIAGATRLGRRLEVLELQARVSAPAVKPIPVAKPATPPPLPPMPSEVPPLAGAPPKREEAAPKPEFIAVPHPAQALSKAVERVKPTTKVAKRRIAEEGWERYIGTYILPRVGIIVVTVAVVTLLVLAARESTPITRVGFGYLVCAALLGVGRWLESKYRSYARVLYSGGIALSYFVTFAAHYIPQARVIESRPMALGLLALVVAIWTVVAQIRKSRIVAVLVTVLGHLTIFLSTQAAGGMENYSVAGVVILSLGSAYFLLRNRWYHVATLGLAGAYINHTYWLMTGHGEDTPAVFWTCMGIVSAYFLIFALAELFADENLRRKEMPTWFRTAFVTVNSACFFALGWFTVSGFTYSKPHQDLFRLGFALTLFLFALAYLHLRKRDPLYNVYMTKAVAMATLGLATRYGGYTLTAWLAVETVALLWSARRSGLVVTRVLAFAVAALTLAFGYYGAVTTGAIAYTDLDYFKSLIPALLTVVGFFVASQLYQRTDWMTRCPAGLAVNLDTQGLLWQLDLIRDRPKGMVHVTKPCEGLLFPYAYAMGGVLTLLVQTFYLAEDGHRFAVYAAFMLLLTLLTGVLKSKPYGLSAMLLGAACLAVGTIEIGLAQTAPIQFGLSGLVALFAASVRADRKLFEQQDALAFHQLPAAPFFLYGITGWLLGLLISVEIDAYLHSALALLAAAYVAAILVLVLHSRALATVATGLLVWAAIGWFAAGEEPHTAQWHIVLWALVVSALGGDRYVALQQPRLRTQVFGHAAVLTAWVLLSQYAWLAAPEGWGIFWIGLAQFALLAYGLGFRSLAAFGAAVVGVAISSVLLITPDLSREMSESALVLSYMVCALFWVLCERLTAMARAPMIRVNADVLYGFQVGAASLLFVIMLQRAPHLHNYITISWTVLAFALFGVSLAMGQRFYRYAGLCIFALAIGRAFIVDTRNLEGFYKVGAFGVLGVILLVVGFGYLQAMARLTPQKTPRRPNDIADLTYPESSEGTNEHHGDEHHDQD
ncbi:MAG: DUF2339 domain-containing protein [Candidatus Hydrogenedentes bacterium]|nr:DUF2339 domain-containing protein [Candidatus Hydrogenedentota bacterium]